MNTSLHDPECVFCGDNPRMVWANDEVAVCSDPAPLAPGHLLIYTRSHYPSAADLDTDTARNVDRVEEIFGAAVRDLLGDYIIFEHGRTGHCLRSRPGERICHHMHVHIIPSAVDPSALVSFGQRRKFESWTEVISLGSETDGYAIVGRSDGSKYFYPITQNLPPHYLRTVIAEAQGTPEMADWEPVVAESGAAEAAPESHELARRIANIVESNVKV